MPRQLKTQDSKANQTQRRSASSSKKEKDSLSLTSYVQVNVDKEWKDFISRINE